MGLKIVTKVNGKDVLKGSVTGDDVVVENLSDLFHFFVPLELYLTTKRSSLPELLILHSQTTHRTSFPLTFVTNFSLNLFDLRLILCKIPGGYK